MATIVHYRGIVVVNAVRIYLALAQLLKVGVVSFTYVIPEYFDILVSIRTRLLMEEAYSMANFVYYDSKGATPTTEVDDLFSS